MVLAPFLARYAAATSPLWPPPTTIASYRPASMRPRIGRASPAPVAAWSGGPTAGLGVGRRLERLGRGVARHLARDHLADRVRRGDALVVTRARPGPRPGRNAPGPTPTPPGVPDGGEAVETARAGSPPRARCPRRSGTSA